MKLTINRITLLFGLILFIIFFFFNRAISGPIVAIFFGGGIVLGIQNRNPNKPYTYGRGLLIGLRIFLLGIIYSIVFLIVISFIKILIDSFRLTGVNIISATQNILFKLFSSFPLLIIISIFSLIPMLIIPLFFLQKSKQPDDIIDADLMDNGEK